MMPSRVNYYHHPMDGDKEFYDSEEEEDDNDESEEEEDTDNIDPNTGLPRSMVMSPNLMKALGLDISEIDTSTDW